MKKIKFDKKTLESLLDIPDAHYIIGSEWRTLTANNSNQKKMKIVVANKKGDKFEAIDNPEVFKEIKKINGRATEHTMSRLCLENHIKRINRKISGMSEVTGKKMNYDGTMFTFHTGSPVANSYRYSRVVNKVVYQIKKNRLVITSLEKRNAFGNSIYSTDGVFILPVKTRKRVSEIINREKV